MKWLLAPDPHAWESLGQWVRRIGQAYGYPSVREFMQAYGFTNLTSADLFYDPPEQALNIISYNTNYSIHLLYRKTCLFFKKVPQSNNLHSCILTYQNCHSVTAVDAPLLFNRRNTATVVTKRHLHREIARQHEEGVTREIAQLCANYPSTSLAFDDLSKLVLSIREAIDICSIVVNSGCEFIDLGSSMRVSNRLELDIICFLIMSRWHNHQSASRVSKPSSLRGRQPGLSILEIADVCRRYENGEKIVEIAGSYSVARSTVYCHLKAYLVAKDRTPIDPATEI